MQRQTLLWTILPTGRNGNRLKATAFLSPRLESNEQAKTKLVAWGDFWNPAKGHWPSIASALTFRIGFDGGPANIVATRTSPDPESSLWGKVFAQDTYVKPYAFTDLSKRMIVSYPAAVLGAVIELQYAVLAAQGGIDMPSLEDEGENSLKGFISTLGIFDQREDGLEKKIMGAMSAVRQGDSTNKTPRVFDHTKLSGFPPVVAPFVAAHLFYNRPKPDALKKYHRYPTIATLPEVPNRPDVPQTDFHMMLAGMSDWPTILRRLGIAIDLEFDIPAGLAASGRVHFETFAAGTFASYTTAGPNAWTRYVLGPKSFDPAPRNDSDIADGYLRLEVADRFRMSTIDIDGAALKTINTARNLHRMLRPRYRTPVTPKRSGLPTLRSAGLQILRMNRGLRVGERLMSVREINNRISALDPTTEYYADELLRGYRVDVRDTAIGTWMSLCQRLARYIVPSDGTTIDVEEEGYVKGASASSSNDGTPDDIYLHEELFGWEGWSLVAPRPGKTIVQDFHEYKSDGKNRKAKMGGREYAEFNRNLDEYGDQRKRVTLETDFRPRPGSLPRLRFGHDYDVRARIVDLAGNSRPPTDGSDQHVIRGSYLRIDPVVIPAMLPQKSFSEGEALERMVIRSNDGMSPEAYVAQTYIQDLLAGLWYTYRKDNIRWLAPPKSSQLNAEFHGMFDDAFGAVDPSTLQKMFNIACREEGTFLDPRIVDIATGLRTIPADGIMLVTPPSTPSPKTAFPPDPWGVIPSPPAGTKYWRPGDPLSPGQYVAHDTSKLILPYLPDPIARGVAFRNLPKSPSGGGAGLLRFSSLPGGRGNMSLVQFGGIWPELAPFRLQIVDGEGEPKWDDGERMLTVFLPQATRIDVLYSSYIGKDPKSGREDISLMRIHAIAPAGKRPDIQRLAEMGSHWMLTPWSTLTLVHAVQKPLKDPEPTDAFKAFKRETGIGETFAAVRGGIGAHVASTGKVDILANWDEPVDHVSEPEPRRIDGKAHIVDFEIGDEFVGFYTDNVQIPVPSAPNMETAKKESSNFYKHEFGDTKYRKVHYYLKGTTRFREYFPAALFRDPVNRAENDGETDAEKLKKRVHRIGPKVVRHIFNSARPAAPVISYVVPTFGWPEEERTERTVLSRRCGNGLRVFVERPWYSSGDGELLGVVFQRSGMVQAENTEALKNVTTRWGRDPIWGSAQMANLPTATSFANVEKHGSNLSIVEREGLRVDVAGYEPQFDKDRGLWFADIEINPGNTYYPFVRLALARYQPNSIPDCHLSPVVRPPFAQLLPDRVAAIVVDSSSDKKIRVMVSGVFGTNQLTRVAPVAAGKIPAPVPNLDLSRIFTVSIEEVGLAVAAGGGGGAGGGGAEGEGRDLSADEKARIAREGQVHELTTRSVRLEKDLTWRPVTSDLKDVPLEQWRKEGDRMVWMAEIALPKGVTGLATGQPRYRVQIREREILETDPDVGSKINRLSREWFVASRVVYADTIILNGKG